MKQLWYLEGQDSVVRCDILMPFYKLSVAENTKTLSRFHMLIVFYSKQVFQ